MSPVLAFIYLHTNLMNQTRTSLASVVLVLGIMLAFYFWILPTHDRIQTLKTDRDAAVAARREAEEAYQSLQTLSEDLSKSQSIQDDLLKAVPVGYAQDTLMNELFALAQNLQFSLSTVSFNPGVDESKGGVLQISASLKGNEGDLVTFVRRIEEADRLIVLKSFSVQQFSPTEVIFNLSLEAYYQ